MSKRIDRILKPCSYALAVPGSKSIGLRHLVMSALATEPSEISRLPKCDDVDAMVDCLSQLGTTFHNESQAIVHITPAFDKISEVSLDVRQSGVSLRLLLAVASLRSNWTHFKGDASLAARPNVDLLDALATAGCEIKSKSGKLPISIRGPATKPSIQIDASLSSQYASALLLVASRFHAGKEIEIKQEIASRSYLDITLNELKSRGIEFEVTSNASTLIDTFSFSQQHYSTVPIEIEGDASSATYHMAMAVLHGGNLTLTNVGNATRQGDYQFTSICEHLGAKVNRSATSSQIQGSAKLKPLNKDGVDMSDMPDAALTLMAIAPYLSEPTHLTGLHTLPLKECDRIECPANELRKAGIRVETTNDSMTIWPGEPQPATFNTYDDHRMAMAFSVLSTKTDGCRIENPNCVSKTYSSFWEDLALAYD